MASSPAGGGGAIVLALASPRRGAEGGASSAAPRGASPTAPSSPFSDADRRGHASSAARSACPLRPRGRGSRASPGSARRS